MSGGIKRLATAVRSAKPDVLVVAPSLVASGGRQSEIKAETLCESLVSMGASAIALGADDGVLGPAFWKSVRTRWPAVMDPTSGVGSSKAGVNIRAASARGELMAAQFGARTASLPPLGPEDLVLYDGTREEAARDIRLKGAGIIVVRSQSKGSWVARSPIVECGSEGKTLVVIEWDGEQIVSGRVIDLGPEWADDAATSRQFDRYVGRVKKEDLLSKLPRPSTETFAGSATCAPCHPKAAKAWRDSTHSVALRSLAKTGQDRDPDCVSCHVVGLDSTHGFRDVATTPELANVGCESCHGAGATHAKNPEVAPMKKVSPDSCKSCHKPAHSPNFDFRKYWAKIRH